MLTCIFMSMEIYITELTVMTLVAVTLLLLPLVSTHPPYLLHTISYVYVFIYFD